MLTISSHWSRRKFAALIIAPFKLLQIVISTALIQLCCAKLFNNISLYQPKTIEISL